MQLRHLRTVLPAGDDTNRVTSMAWSPDNQKLAVASSDRTIQLFDEAGERKDKFSTKPADSKISKSYTIVGLAFSPDGTKLAVAQSDCVVYVYKLGLGWGEKKSICNKFIQSSEITSLSWPRKQHNALIFGLLDGKVRIGNLKSNKAATLLGSESCVVSTTCNPDGSAVMSGHDDGTINRFFFEDENDGSVQGKFTVHSCPPEILVWGETIMAAGVDQIVTVYDSRGRSIQKFDYSQALNFKGFSVSALSPSAQSTVIGSFDCLYIYNWSQTKQIWEEMQSKKIENFYTVSAISWKPDGSKLAIGNIANSVEIFDCCLRKSRYKGKFEFNYVSTSQVIVKRLSTGSRIVLKSHYGYEVQKINIFQDQFLIAHTPETLLVGDLASCKLSEVPWMGSGNEKYYFDHPNVCLVFNAGELSVVEYGVNEALGSCRTEHMSPHQISVRINDRKSKNDVKRVAYLVDILTIQVLDMLSGLIIATVTNDSSIDWLELSGKGEKLLFRDKKSQLYLYDIPSQTKVTMLNICSYVQWVPFSDVVVAQSRGNLCIWYSVDSPEKVTMFPIQGEIEDIERANGKTEVIVDEGVNTVSYTLDESLIDFGSALDEKDFERAIVLLEKLEMTSETEAMWKTLSNVAIKDQKLNVAERCYAALGDVSKALYIRNMKVDQNFEEVSLNVTQNDSYLIRVKLALLEKQFTEAENFYLERGKVDEAMEMYQELHKWDQVIKVAESRNHPELANLQKNYFQWLIDTNQEEKAAEIKEKEGDHIYAVNLYLKCGMPVLAANILLSNHLESNFDLTERVTTALSKAELSEKAGEIYERVGSIDRALDAYIKGNHFRAAIDVCRKFDPSQIVKLEEQWGDYLAANNRSDAAISHYIEAGKSFKALEAAITAKQWKKAVEIIDCLDAAGIPGHQLIKVANYYQSIEEYEIAKKYYVAAGQVKEAVDMYDAAGEWEKSYALAITNMKNEDAIAWYRTKAFEMEGKNKLKDAERLFIILKQPDSAIKMYEKHRQYDQMTRLVSIHQPELLKETQMKLAKGFQLEGDFKAAEKYYICAGDFKAAVNMFCSHGLYEDGHRLAKSHMGVAAGNQIAMLWAKSVGGEAAVKLLTKLNLIDSAITFASENGDFGFAFELARYSDPSKVAEVHLKHAMLLEDEGKFKEAEDAFVLAGRPREAILMYIHDELWDEALAVAENHDPASVVEVLVGQAKAAFIKNDYEKFEGLLLRAQKPELAIKLYQDSNNWREAIRFTKQYLPSKLNQLNQAYDKFLISQSDGGKENLIATAQSFEQQKEYARAIELYLKLKPEHSEKVGYVVEKWKRAAELAIKFLPEKSKETVAEVCVKLIEIKYFSQAGDLYAGIEMDKNAVDAFIQGNMWDKAKKVAATSPKLQAYYESLYVNHLKSSGQVEALADVDSIAGIEALAQRGEWEKCLDIANTTKNSDMLVKHLHSYCTLLLSQGKCKMAIKSILKYGSPCAPALLDIYQKITNNVLQDPEADAEDLLNVRDALFQIHSTSGTIPQAKIIDLFSHSMQISHLLSLRAYCSCKEELLGFAAKQAISLLRYTAILPADRVFMEAGKAAKNAGMLSMAFVCWNRFLDITEAIEEQDNTLLAENSDFQNTDVPFDVKLSKTNVETKTIEEIRDWILQTSLDAKVNQEVDKRECDSCGTVTYAASLTCHGCKKISESCIVTGYPIGEKKVNCSSCGKGANKDDWNKYLLLERCCPWCKNSQAPAYFE